MTREEYSEWALHFARRFPTTGKWLMELPGDTRDAWFTEVFSELELRDCLAVTIMLVSSGELAAYDREKLPAIYVKKSREVQYLREFRASQRRSKPDEEFIRRSKELRGGDGYETIRRCSIMGPAFTFVMDRIRGWQTTHEGHVIDADTMREFVDEAFVNVPSDDDYAPDGPRYKCPKCFDTGFVSYRDSRDRPCAGHCECDTGNRKGETLKWDSGRRLGPVPQTEAVEWEWDNDSVSYEGQLQ